MFKIGSAFLAENPPNVKIAGAETAPGTSTYLSLDRPHFEENPQNCTKTPHSPTTPVSLPVSGRKLEISVNIDARTLKFWG